jgi:Zn-dependent peptidase ImmA (M78 family)/DNA-binding XRE family transcriptional regulator
MTRAELAGVVHVSAAAVGQWEAGEARPKPKTLLRVAAELRFPVNYFGAIGRELSVDPERTFFRSLRKSKQIDREAAVAHASLIAELVEIIAHRVALPSFDVPSYRVALSATDEEIDALALQVRAYWQLGGEPIVDMVRELERHGTVTARLELADDVDAFSCPYSERAIVILGTDKNDKARSRLSAAHELGHLVMHRDHPKPADRTLEAQAFRFGSAFLVPPDQLISEWPKGRLNWRDLLRLKHRWQISLAALMYRARVEHLITPSVYDSTIKYMSRIGWRRTEPGDLGPPERPRLLSRAVELLQEHGTGEAALADETHIPLRELQSYVQLSTATAWIRLEI